MTEDLKQKRCIPCAGDVPPLDPVAATGLLRQVPAWRIADGEPARLTRRFTFPDFRGALAWVNAVGELAEAEGHHPDVAIHYNVVDLEVWTHAIRGLSESDFILAAKVDALPLP
ncbi:MAG: 4a-hydroxytetrahydrobiopterin dehydratase [Candidatus Sericytochromatia bacterium]|nr:4a-hydroxytetrahydrobiopterin dehydratase [Candidatus Sericytochromatia bacterium]